MTDNERLVIFDITEVDGKYDITTEDSRALGYGCRGLPSTDVFGTMQEMSKWLHDWVGFDVVFAMIGKIIEAPITWEEPVNLKAASVICSRLQRYNEIEQIIEEYKRQPSGNVFTNDKYFKRILEVFEAD